MTREVIEIEAKDAGTVHVLVGAIGEIYSDEEIRTADVTIDGYGVVNKIPVFYHCPEAETATEGNPFIENDRVLVVNYGDAADLSANDMKIIGFEDGLPRECGFQFKLTRDDGTVINSAEYEWADIFSCRNASGQNFAPENIVYNETTQYWSFNIPGFARDEDGYWIKFNWVEDSITTVYPYRYKTADQYQEVDLIKPAKYEAVVPYWKLSYENNTPVYIKWAEWGSLSCDEKFAGLASYPHFYWDAPGTDYYRYTTQSSFYKKITVKSSVPYKITENLSCSTGQYISCFGYNATGIYGVCPDPASLCLSYSASTRFYGEQLDVTYETNDTWVSTSAEHTHSPNIGGQTYIINAEVTAGSGVYHVECWEWPEGIFHEKDVVADWYKNLSNKREISNFISISASYNY